MTKEDINRPEPGSLPPRISFVEQMGRSAGYYVRFKDIPKEEGGPIRKYVPILQWKSQEEALQAAIDFRDRKARELGLPKEPSRGPHDEQARGKMSEAHNRLGLRGLGLTLSKSGGTIYPVLGALWSGENGQRQVRRSMTCRGLFGAMEELAPHLREHLHPQVPEEELLRRGAEGAARRLVQIARSSESQSSKRERIESFYGAGQKRTPGTALSSRGSSAKRDGGTSPTDCSSEPAGRDVRSSGARVSRKCDPLAQLFSREP